MLKALLLSLTLALAVRATAQNLVPNGSFEDTVNCGIVTQSTIYKAAHWYNPNNATPDVWDCDLERLCGMPMSPAGGNQIYQYSFNGTRHAGGVYWYGPGSSNARDYFGVRLSEPFSAGMTYEVSLYYVRRRFQHAIDHIGVWFGPDSLWQNTTWWLNVVPQVKLRDPESTFLLEGQEWTLLNDTLVAQGGEQWMVIGNFDVADSVNGILADPEAINGTAYYFIDDVAVREVGPVNTVSRAEAQAWWGVDGLIVRWPAGFDVERIVVHDALGRVVMDKAVHAAHLEVRSVVSSDAAGLYIVQLLGAYTRSTVKVVKGEG